MKLLAATIITMTLLQGCGVIHDYELDRLAQLCGGVDKIKFLMIDLDATKAKCNDGTMVNVTDSVKEWQGDT